MAQQIIGIGSSANDGTGDPLRTAFDKINDNFTELYAAIAALEAMPDVSAGAYVPTVSNTSNLDSNPTISGGRYIRIGNDVWVAFTFNADATASGDTMFQLSLPVTSNLAATTDLSGNAVAYISGAISGGAIIGNVANDTAQIRINAGSTSARDYTAFFRYVVQ